VRLGKGTLLKLDPQDVIVVAIKSFDETRGTQDDLEAEV
jgi:translation initiation factor IF-1